MEIANEDERCTQVAEYIRSNGEKTFDIFGIRDIESYMAGHPGLAGLALHRTRSATDDFGGNQKRPKTEKRSWEVCLF
jgi:hypothetical protein